MSSTLVWDVGVTQAESKKRRTAGTRRLRWETLLERGRPTALELVVASGLLLVLAIVMYAPHVVHGGFYYDDWANYAATHYSGDGGFGTRLITTGT